MRPNINLREVFIEPDVINLDVVDNDKKTQEDEYMMASGSYLISDPGLHILNNNEYDPYSRILNVYKCNTCVSRVISKKFFYRYEGQLRPLEYCDTDLVKNNRSSFYDNDADKIIISFPKILRSVCLCYKKKRWYHSLRFWL